MLWRQGAVTPDQRQRAEFVAGASSEPRSWGGWKESKVVLTSEPTRPMARPLPNLRDPVWKLGIDVAALVIQYVLEERDGRQLASRAHDQGAR